MSKLVYPTTRAVQGPLLFSKEQLTRLDEIVERKLPHIEALQEQIWKRELAKDLERDARYRKEKFTEADIEERRKNFEKQTLERRRAERTRRIVLHLGGGRRLVVESFAEAGRHPELMNHTVSGFDLELDYYPARASVTAWGGGESTRLTITVRPEENEGTQDLFSEISEWADGIAAPKWQRIWLNAFPVFLLWFAWFFCALLWYAGNTNNTGKAYYQAQAGELLQKGVTPQNEMKAIELLLALQSDYKNQQIPPSKPSSRFWLFLVGGALVCLALSFPPGLVVGLGKGEKELARWQSWIKFVSITVPAFLASTFLWPTVTIWLRALIK